MEHSSVVQLILLCFICKRMSMIYASSTSRSSSNCILPTLFCLPWKIMLLESDMMESGSSFSEDLGTNFFSTICLGTRLLSAIRRFSARNDDSSPSQWVPSWRIDKAGGFFSSEPPLSRVSLGSFFLPPPSSFYLFLLLLDKMVCRVMNSLEDEERTELMWSMW